MRISLWSSLHRFILFTIPRQSTMLKFLQVSNMGSKSKAATVAAPLRAVSPASASVTQSLKAAQDQTPDTAASSTAATSQVSSPGSIDFMSVADPHIKAYITWEPSGGVPYSAVVDTFEAISKVSGRLDKENLLARLFAAVAVSNPSDLETIVYLAANAVHPAYEGLELGIGDSLLVKAVCEATGRKKEAVDEAYSKEGDLGEVAVASRQNQSTLNFSKVKPKPLTAVQVLDTFRQITVIKGEKSQARKIEALKGMLVRCVGMEAKYLVRAMQGKLRIGLAAQTVLVSLAHAMADLQSAFPYAPSTAAEQEEEADTEAAAAAATDHVTADREESSMEVDDTAGSTHKPSFQELLSTYLPSEHAHHSHSPPEAIKLRRHMAGERRLNKEELYLAADQAVKRAFSECPNYTLLTQALLSSPLHLLSTSCKLTIGVPVSPMLAKPSKEVTEVLKRLQGQAFTMEYKYDGERAQVHLLPDINRTAKIFSRNSEDNSGKYPDLRQVTVDAAKEGVVSCILDAEVVAYDRERQCLLPFQVLSTRKRKADTDIDGKDENKVKVILQPFDLLYLNGHSLLRLSLRQRREIMYAAFNQVEGAFKFAMGLDHVEDGDTAPIEQFLSEACTAACEGLMVKTLDDNASYEPSKRSLNWLKLKKDYLSSLGYAVCDSVDLVVIGGYHGRGKRTGVYGAYLMACYDPETEEFQSVCKVGTGFKDEDLIRLSATLRPHIMTHVQSKSKSKPSHYNVGSEALYPDDWFEPVKVWELQAADLSRSSAHRGGVGHIESDVNDGTIRGIGLRFPRFMRERDDKAAIQATTSEQIVDFFRSQDQSNAGKGKGSGAEKGDGEESDEDFI